MAYAQQKTQNSTVSLPYLWVSNILATEPLRNCFSQIYSPKVPPTSLEGHHILALDPDTPERLWKEIAYSLLGAGCEVSVKEVGRFNKQPLEWWLQETPANHVAIEIISQHIPYSEWEESRAKEPLTLKEALELAELVLVKLGEGEQANIALDALRRRANVSEWNWDKKYLGDVRARLEKSLALSSPQTDPKERLRLDVKALLKESDPIAYEVMRVDIQSRYRLNHKALERIIRSISQLTKEAEVVDMGLDELFDLPTENLEYVIPGMLPVGEAALLIANPKAGKSLLAYDAAFAVATGEDTFLGEQCKQGKVLIVQCDESSGTAKGRLLKRGFRREDTPNVRFMHKFRITQLAALEAKLETFRPTLVIIDSLRKINAGREVSENSAEFADNIYELKELCSQYNAALILIHHSNKNSEAVGVEKVRGSSAIAGATWGIWELTQIPKPDPKDKKKLIIDPKDPTRILSIIARDVEGQRLSIELDPENNHWINRGEEGANQEEVREQKTHSAKVIEILQSVAPVGLEASEINDRLGLGRGIYSVLNRLLGQKIIGSRPSTKDRRRTVYFCSTVTQDEQQPTAQQVGNPPPPTLTAPNVIKYPEFIDMSSVQSSITLDHKSITFDHIPPVGGGEKQASNAEPVSNTEYSITSSSWAGERGSSHDALNSELSHAGDSQHVEQHGDDSLLITGEPSPETHHSHELIKQPPLDMAEIIIAVTQTEPPPESARASEPMERENTLVEEMIAEATETIQFQLERDAIVDWQEVINMINAYEFNDSQKREVKRRLEAWNPAMVRDTYERTKRIEVSSPHLPLERKPKLGDRIRLKANRDYRGVINATAPNGTFGIQFDLASSNLAKKLKEELEEKFYEPENFELID
jgi:archaellum biogenesis ATPase FlaH